MRPIFADDPPRHVLTDYGTIVWDAENNRPVDWQAKTGRDFAQALADNDGMTAPDPYVPPPAPIPQSVSRMQAMVALSRAGLLTAVQSWVVGQDAETQLIWNNAPDFSRGSTMLVGAAAALGLSSDQVDALFVAAAAITP